MRTAYQERITEGRISEYQNRDNLVLQLCTASPPDSTCQRERQCTQPTEGCLCMWVCLCENTQVSTHSARVRGWQKMLTEVNSMEAATHRKESNNMDTITNMNPSDKENNALQYWYKLGGVPKKPGVIHQIREYWIQDRASLEMVVLVSPCRHTLQNVKLARH